MMVQRSPGINDERSRALQLFYGGLVRRQNTLAIMMQKLYVDGLDQRALGSGGITACARRKRSRQRRL